MEKRIYLSPPHVDQQEETMLLDALRSGWVAPVGPLIRSFEGKLANQFHFKNVLALHSGSASLHLAVRLSGIGLGDKVLIGTFTFVAAANAVLYEGGVPVFIDSERDTWNIDHELLENRLRKGREHNESIKAVIVTHLYGTPAKILEIQRICKDYKVILIEDAAEAVGSRVGKEYLGGFGEFGVFSFNGNKIITTGGGGALISQSSSDHSKAKYLAEQAKEPVGHYQHSEIGYNYRLSNVLAGLGLAQLTKLEEFIAKKRIVFDRYKNALVPFDCFEFNEELPGDFSNRWLSCFLIKQEFIERIKPDDIIQALEKENIEARRLWKPLHLQPLFAGAEYCGANVAEDTFNRGFCLPSGVGLSDLDQDRVIETTKMLLVRRGLLK